MEKDLECTKIKDGLYLGNCRTAQDADFLFTNKFHYIINCASQLPNIFEGHGIKYIKFKLVRDKPHKLWDGCLKKLKKLQKFIQICEEHSICCLIHSFDGVNRSLVMLSAFLMSRYRWTLSKTLQFVRSKKIFIGLSEHYIQQLQILQQILNQTEPKLSSEWKTQYKTHQEQIISKTFLNSQQIQYVQKIDKIKKQKRVVWKDILEKEKKKQQKQLKQKQKLNKIKSNEKKFQSIDLNKKGEEKKQKAEVKDSGSLKKLKGKNLLKNQNTMQSKPEIHYLQSNETSEKQLTEVNLKNKKTKQKMKKDENFDEDQLIKLIKKNIKSKKKLEENCLNMTQDEGQQKIYNVTINNFIKPNINIVNNQTHLPQKKKQTKARPQSAWKKEKEKINRTLSQKQGIKPFPIHSKDRSLKNMQKKNIETSPKKQKKYDKFMSTLTKASHK